MCRRVVVVLFFLALFLLVFFLLSDVYVGLLLVEATTTPYTSKYYKNNEKFRFCMCNPPFFETMDEGSLNPNTFCGDTPAEMVWPGGEQAFISRMIQDCFLI
ncbi:putative METTL16/RlmF family protein [Helianthus annuus]|nr:putative METTL16/RlmF family protein [Helianthus annuus]